MAPIKKKVRSDAAPCWYKPVFHLTIACIKKIVRGCVRCIVQISLNEKKIDMIFLVGLKAHHSLNCNGVLYIVVGDHFVTSDSYPECLPCHLSFTYVLAVDRLYYYVLLRKTSYKTALLQQMFSWK